MTTTATPIFAQSPLYKSLSLAAVTACSTRAPTVTANLATSNILELLPTSANGVRVDMITVVGCSSAITAATTAGLIGVWVWDGTTAYLLTEIVISAVTPSTTVPSFTATYIPPIPLVLPSTYKLFASTTVTTTASTNALEVNVFGGNY